MILLGINTFSLIDYPGKISSVIYTAGCNLRCGYCHNKEMVLPQHIQENQKNVIPEQAFFRFLSKRVGLIDAVSICGGEPTFQAGLVDFCSRVKSLGFSLKLDTNGSNPHILEKLLSQKLLDYVAMDIKYDFSQYEVISGKKESVEKYFQSIEIIKTLAPDYEFRTTCVSPYHTEEIMKSIGKTVQGAKKFFLQNFREGHTLDPQFFGEPFFPSELENYKQILLEYVDAVEVRS